jgi:hypothetical protein
VLLLAVAFRIQAAAGRTLISAAGERAAILLPLVVLIAAGAVAFAVVVPQVGLLGAAWVAAFLAMGTALVSLRDGIRLLGLRYPWATLARVLTASAATAGLGLWLLDRGLHVLLDLTLATLFYGTMLLLLREWRPTPKHMGAFFNQIVSKR